MVLQRPCLSCVHLSFRIESNLNMFYVFIATYTELLIKMEKDRIIYLIVTLESAVVHFVVVGYIGPLTLTDPRHSPFKCMYQSRKVNIYVYYTLRFYFPYLSLLALPATIYVYGPARYLHYFR